MGKLVLYMLNLIKTLNVIMKKSDTDFTGVLTSTGTVLTVLLRRAGPALRNIFERIYASPMQISELLVWISPSGTLLN